MIARMFSKLPLGWLISCLLAGGAGVLASSGCTEMDTAVESEEVLQLRQEWEGQLDRFHIAQSAIRQTQAAAMEDSAVQVLQEEFYAKLRQFIEREGAEGGELLDHALGVGADLERLAGPMVMIPRSQEEARAIEQERREIAGELVATEQRLRPYIDRALADPEVRQAFSVLREALESAMKRLDPNAEAYLDRMYESAERMHELEVEMARRQGER